MHAASAAETQSLSFLDIALWVVLPYVSFAILIVGPRVALQDGPSTGGRLVPRSGMSRHPALGIADVPLRCPLRVRGPRHGPRDPEDVDRGGRVLSTSTT